MPGSRLSIWQAIHGTCIEKMGSLAHFIRDKRLPLEMCLSSNKKRVLRPP